MTGRNLQEEAGAGKGGGGGCKTPKERESSDKGPGVPFSPEQESLFWDLTKQNQKTKKEKEKRAEASEPGDELTSPQRLPTA